MGKVVIIMVVLIAVIFAVIMLSVHRTTPKVPEVLSDRGVEYDIEYLVSYSLNQALKKIPGNVKRYFTSITYEVLVGDYIDTLYYDFNYKGDSTKVYIHSYVSMITPNPDTIYGAGEAEVRLLYETTTVDKDKAYEYAILSCEDMTFTGSGIIDVGEGLVHTNGNFKMPGSGTLRGNLSSSVRIWCTGSTIIHGDATTPVWKGMSPGNVTGTATTASVDPIAIPDIDLTPYYNEALANGEVYTGDQHFSVSSTIQPVGGIMWVDGDLKISGSGNIIGCFIATGYIKISGSGDQIKVGDYPAIVSRDSYIDISGDGQFHGLIYAPNGYINKSGSGDVVGSIICGGEFKKSRSWSIMTYEDSTPVPPSGGGT